MNIKISELVHKYYWDMDINCARTMLLSLGELFQIEINTQTLNSAIGLHGAGGYRAQCGLVEGSLMFLGIYCSINKYSESQISGVCYQFADEFVRYFSSFQCFDLRPNGFTDHDPIHACEGITVKAVCFTYDFIRRYVFNDCQHNIQ